MARSATHANFSTTEHFNHVIISIENFQESETWFLILCGVLTLLLSVLCGIWCLLAAKNVKEDGKIHFDEEEKGKSRDSRSTAGSDFSVIEVEKEEVKEPVALKNYLIGVGKSLVFMKS